MKQHLATAALVLTALLAPTASAAAGEPPAPSPTAPPTTASATGPATSPATAASESPEALPTAPAPTQLSLDLVAVLGTGCPAGTAAAALNPTSSGFSVYLSQYVASTTVTNEQVEKACQLLMRLNAPGEFTYAVSAVRYSGYRHLADNAGAQLGAIYYFQGSMITTYQNHEIPPGSGRWEITDRIPENQLAFKPCGERRDLNIKTRLTTYQRNATGENFVLMNTFGPVDPATDTFQLTWKRC